MQIESERKAPLVQNFRRAGSDSLECFGGALGPQAGEGEGGGLKGRGHVAFAVGGGNEGGLKLRGRKVNS